MAKKKAKKNKPSKFKGSLTHIIRKLYDKNSSKEYSVKEICTQLSIREGELRKQTYGVLKDLVNAEFLKETSHGTFKLNQNTKTVEGEFQLTQRGSGYLLTDKSESDIYLSLIHI
jgi:hypothetical protein